jgi:Fic-DOC domain mobile mystery protein B
VALTLEYPAGATPLDPNELEGLIPRHLATQQDLNEWEQNNILPARTWLYARVRPNVLSEQFNCDLHRRMFGNTWRWAGQFRQSEKNIGAPWPQVPTRLRQLFENTRFRLDLEGTHVDEEVAHFHHRLVLIHAFANGNGRHARLMADALLRERRQIPFTWGRVSLVDAGEVRERYIGALRDADKGNIRPLLEFVRL